LFGVAPKIQLIDLRALNSNGVGTDSSVIRAIDRAIELKSQYNIRVINLSLGLAHSGVVHHRPALPGGRARLEAGIVVVVAAGNRGRVETVTDKNGKSYRIDGYGTIGSPGNDPFVITVGAVRDMNTPTRADDLIASYSSKGPSRHRSDRQTRPDRTWQPACIRVIKF
jgi:serine protease AprX